MCTQRPKNQSHWETSSSKLLFCPYSLNLKLFFFLMENTLCSYASWFQGTLFPIQAVCLVWHDLPVPNVKALLFLLCLLVKNSSASQIAPWVDICRMCWKSLVILLSVNRCKNGVYVVWHWITPFLDHPNITWSIDMSKVNTIFR